MKFTHKDRGLMRSLIAKGTAVGPVTQEMIDLAVKKYEWANEKCGYPAKEIEWSDFIEFARKELETKSERS